MQPLTSAVQPPARALTTAPFQRRMAFFLTAPVLELALCVESPRRLELPRPSSPLKKCRFQFAVGARLMVTTSAAGLASMTAIRPNTSSASVRRTKMKADAGLCGLPRRSLAVQRAHQDAEIEPGDMDQIALVEVFPSAQPSPSHAAAIEDMGEGAFDHLAAPAHGLAPDSGFQPRPVGVNRCARRLVAMPAQIALGRLRFGDARLPHAPFQRLQLFTRVIPFVGGQTQGSSSVGASPTSPRLRSAISRVGESVAVSPSSAGWIGAATTTPVSRSTACSGL